MTDHHCPQNKTLNEVWPEAEWCKPMFVLVGDTETGHFEHNEKINFCPYCGMDLRLGKEDGRG